ncbi:hypothetical protein [Desulfovibrio cuneatus]|uniref:hypothetical protein n=1 Tax=Desulfovibrio cuneatus TaxID=159728 RepID=UPI0003FF82C9|nr:hypothetical protein [Desulfovibrio cuneatus]
MSLASHYNAFEQRFREHIYKYADILFLLIVSVAAIVVRQKLVSFESGDYLNCLLPWYTKISNEGFAVFQSRFSDYTMPYLYLMYFFTKLHVAPLYAIKIISCISDFLLAAFTGRTVYTATGNKMRGQMAYAVTLCLPTVLLNGAAWGQCDSLLTLFIVVALYYMLKASYVRAMLAYSVALCFKLQGIFVLPVFMAFALVGPIPLWTLFLPVICYMLFYLPIVLFAGAPVSSLFLKALLAQSKTFKHLTMSAPTLWSFIHDVSQPLKKGAQWAGLTFVFTGCFAFFKMRPSVKHVLLSMAFFATAVPFFLPRMHERYFFIADILTLIYAFYEPKRFYVPALVVLASLTSYMPFLFEVSVIPLQVGAAAIGVAVAVLGADLYHSLTATTTPKTEQC